ncbi:MAG: chloride channel protein [Clostridia bacterium]|nr:chloride channel protein [Clostridia bacterium]
MFNRVKPVLQTGADRIKQMLLWACLTLFTGGACGLIGTLFHVALDRAGEWFSEYEWLIWLMPVAGALIVSIYRLLRQPLSLGTDQVFESARAGEGVPWQMAPLIFAGTFLTHLTGGSAGREGAALQLGGSLSCQIGRLFKLDKTSMHIIEMCGMSALFSALFGTPVAAAFFAIEVVDVGLVRYKALLPCMLSSLAAYLISGALGVEATRFILKESLIALSAADCLRVLILSLLCGLVAVLFCESMHFGQRKMKQLIKNDYLRSLASAALVIALTYIFGTRDYNGAGMGVIRRALNGGSADFAWLIKLLFTVITLSGGFRGGEIVPSFFVGACFGCAVAGLLGLDPALAAALGMIGVFCGVTNAPAASLLIACEMFSGQYFLFFALTVAVSFFASGKTSLYHSQKYLESKYIWDKE